MFRAFGFLHLSRNEKGILKFPLSGRGGGGEGSISFDFLGCQKSTGYVYMIAKDGFMNMYAIMKSMRTGIKFLSLLYLLG